MKGTSYKKAPAPQFSKDFPIAFPNENVMAIARREEPRLMSLLMHHKDLFANAVESGMTYNHFTVSSMRELFSIMDRYYDKNEASHLSREAFGLVLSRSMGDEETARLRQIYDSIWAERVSVEDFPMLKQGVEDRFMQICLWDVTRRGYEQLLNATAGQKDMVQQLQDSFLSVRALGDKSFNRAQSLGDVMVEEVMPDVYLRRDHPELFKGMTTDYEFLDSIFHGFQRGRYMVVTAMEGGGKTTFMLNLARRFAKRGEGVVYVTIESGNSDVGRRLLTIDSAVNYNRIMEGGTDTAKGLPQSIMRELEESSERIRGGFGGNFHLVQVLERTPARDIIRLVKQVMAKNKVSVVFIDYLQVVGTEISRPDRADLEIADVSDTFRAFGRESNVFVVAAQQIKSDKSKKLDELRLKPEKVDTVEINKSDLSESKRITGSCDHMLSVWILPGKERMRCWVTKNRQGKDGEKGDFAYDADTGRIENLPGPGGYGNIEKAIASPDHRKRIESGEDTDDQILKQKGKEPPEEKPKDPISVADIKKDEAVEVDWPAAPAKATPAVVMPFPDDPPPAVPPADPEGAPDVPPQDSPAAPPREEPAAPSVSPAAPEPKDPPVKKTGGFGGDDDDGGWYVINFGKPDAEIVET